MGKLPDWCDPLPDAQMMRALDGWAIETHQVPSLELMERAGAGVARAVEAIDGDGRILVVCGKGNNGGDGLVAARLLREGGRAVTVVLAASESDLEGDARENLLRLPGEPPAALEHGPGGAQEGVCVVVDALLGTGSAGAPQGQIAEAIELVNRSGLPVLGVDVPSGVDASTGTIAGVAVRAARTVTFHRAKPGLWINPGKSHAGVVEAIDIGIPRGAPLQASVGLLRRAVAQTLPGRGASSTKFTSGHVLVVGGSVGLSGAPRMAAQAAMRTGAGYLTACVPASLQTVLSCSWPELMSKALPDREGQLSEDGIEIALQMLEPGGALALGPGLGRSQGAQEFARGLARSSSIPMVLDADGLNAHAGRLEDLIARKAPTVLTPHAGEMGRLLGCDSAEVERERLSSVRRAAQLSGAVVVLKGDDTLIADPQGAVAISEGRAPALATAGTGDVLTGVIAALLSQGLEPFTAAAAGVWIHAEAGRRAALSCGGAEGVIASDVIAALPGARASGATL